MAASLFNRYIWLVDTIYRAGYISREEIDRRWARSQYNDLHEPGIPARTFHRHKEAIRDIFDIEIRCDGAQEAECLQAAVELVDSGLGE